MKYRIVTFSVYFTATVWVVSGLICKILGLVPRHELIVARILGPEHAIFFTKAIGIGEVLMAVWIVSRIKPAGSSYAQIVIVAAMNILEFILAQDLLLFGRFNIVIAMLFIIFVASVENMRKKQLVVAAI